MVVATYDQKVWKLPGVFTSALRGREKGPLAAADELGAQIPSPSVYMHLL